MNADNSNYNPWATEHVPDYCAVQVYGCTDATALNYDISATNICAGISEDQCCTETVSGCTDENYENYNESANSDDGSCSGAINFGCMVQSSCNYNPNATADCSMVTGGTNSNCCEASNSTPVVCVLDFDNDGFQDENTNSQTLASGNCGCSTLGYGWTNSDNTNGEAIWGCTDPACPEYNPQANLNNGECCLGFTAEDATYMYTAEYSLLGGYIVDLSDLSDCQDDMGGGGPPEDYHEELYIFLGWGGVYHEEYLSIHELTGFRAPPRYEPTYDSPADCEAAASGANWYCGNQVADPDSYYPCEEEYFETQCEERAECWWEAPECRWNTSEWVGDTCFDNENMSSQSACTADPGCQWNQQWNGCYFDCWGLDETTCQDAALVDECWWKTPDTNDGYCSAPATNYEQCNQLGSSGGQCYVNGIVDPAYTTAEACYSVGSSCTDPSYTTFSTCDAAGQWWNYANSWWDQDYSTCWGYEDWDTGEFVCECEVDNVNNCQGSPTTDNLTCEQQCTASYTGTWTTMGDAQCEQKPYEDACNSYESSSDCNDAPAAESCKWDYQGGWCFKEQGADCWMESMQTEASCTASSDCEWWMPPGYSINNVPAEFQDVVEQNPGVCNFYDWCNDYYCWEGECDEAGCNNDSYCRWHDQPGQPPSCVEDAQAQYCECYVEWTQPNCQANTGTIWDYVQNECLQSIDENTCYNEDDITMGPEDGNIDCGDFMGDNVNQYTEWDPEDNVCELIFEESLEGTWSIEGNTLCIQKEDNFEEENCSNMYFEECQCNDHRCNWAPAPTFDNPDNGYCSEGTEGPGMGRSSETCMHFVLMDNGSIHLTQTNPDGSPCPVMLLLEDVEYCDENGNVLDCAGVCGGSTEWDECGVCSGNGIPDGACDCAGNDFLDECGICGGPGPIYDCGCEALPGANGDGDIAIFNRDEYFGGGDSSFYIIKIELRFSADPTFDEDVYLESYSPYNGEEKHYNALYRRDVSSATMTAVDGSEYTIYQDGYDEDEYFEEWIGSFWEPWILFSTNDGVVFVGYDDNNYMQFSSSIFANNSSNYYGDGIIYDESGFYGETIWNINSSYEFYGYNLQLLNYYDNESIELPDCVEECFDAGLISEIGDNSTLFCELFVIDADPCLAYCDGESLYEIFIITGICELCLELDSCDGVFGSYSQAAVLNPISNDSVPVTVTMESTKCDCDGNIWDCSGACGGDMVADGCGICDNDPENDNNDKDCAGVCFGTHITDAYGGCCFESSFDDCNQCYGNDWDYCDEDEDGINNLDQLGYGASNITVADIPDDQGGRVYVNFHGSYYDFPDESIPAMGSYIIQRLDGEEWIIVQSFDAFREDYYIVEVTTLYNNVVTEYRVIASMGGDIYYSNENGFGTSIDNIAPSIPADLNLNAGYIEGVTATLSWSSPVDDDFQQFNIYSNDALLTHTTESFYENTSVDDPYTERSYFITATDINGNESDPSEMVSLLFTIIQPVTIETGKVNMISLKVVPENILMSSVFSDNILLAGNDRGQFYYPEYNVDQIENLDITEGYQIILGSEGTWTLEVTGLPADPYQSILIEAGKLNMIPYLPQESFLASEVFGAFADQILLVKNDEGYFYSPDYEISDELITLTPGEGYYVFLKEGVEDIEFSYPENALSRNEFTSTLEINRQEHRPDHYKVQSTGLSQSILISSLRGIVEVGDEMAAYANGQLVGAVRITDLDLPVPLIAVEGITNYGLDLPGYIKGDLIELRLWSNSQQRELRVVADFNEPRFGMSPLSIGTAVVYSDIPSEYSLSQAYPNPFNPVTKMRYSLAGDGYVEMVIYNIAGQKVHTLISGQKEAGYYTAIWDASSYPSGMYFVKLHARTFIKTQKLIFVK